MESPDNSQCTVATLESWRNKTFRDILFRHQSTSLLPSHFTSSTGYSCFLTRNPDLTFQLILQFNIKHHHNCVGSFTPPGRTEPLSRRAGQLNRITLQKHLPKAWKCFFRRKDTIYPTSASYWEAPGTTRDVCHIAC